MISEKEEKEIEEFVSSLTVQDREKEKYRSDLKDMFSILGESGLTYPTEESYQKFRERKIQENPNITKNTLKDRDNRVRRYFKAKQEKERQITMLNDTEEINNVHDIHDMGNAQSEYLAQQATNESEAQSENLITGQTTDIQQPAPSQVATTEKAKSAPEKRSVGRPKRTDGVENRSKRFALQLQPALCEKLNILAKYDECSATEILTRILEQYINTRIDDINYMVRMNEELKARKAKQN